MLELQNILYVITQGTVLQLSLGQQSGDAAFTVVT